MPTCLPVFPFYLIIIGQSPTIMSCFFVNFPFLLLVCFRFSFDLRSLESSRIIAEMRLPNSDICPILYTVLLIVMRVRFNSVFYFGVVLLLVSMFRFETF